MASPVPDRRGRMMERPGWWPERWWPRVAGPGEEALPSLPDRRSTRVGEPLSPVESFLRTLAASSGAGSAVIFRLDRDAGTWREAVGPGGGRQGERRTVPAAGHPLTWSLREELVLQVSTGELFGGRGTGWSVLGPVPAADRVLVLGFVGSPPSSARRGIRPATEHLEALHRADLL